MDSAFKSAEPLLGRIPAATIAILQEGIAAGHREKPQVTGGGFALDLRVQHFNGCLVDLEVIAGHQLLPDQVIDGQQEKGDLLDPLHHLLAGNDHTMALPENPFQRVIGHMIVKAA